MENNCRFFSGEQLSGLTSGLTCVDGGLGKRQDGQDVADAARLPCRPRLLLQVLHARDRVRGRRRPQTPVEVRLRTFFLFGGEAFSL